MWDIEKGKPSSDKAGTRETISEVLMDVHSLEDE